jgi:hypothetical protein
MATGIIFKDKMFRLVDEYTQMCGSQKNAADDIGISYSYLNDILSGRRKVGPKVAKYFGYKPVTVFQEIMME